MAANNFYQIAANTTPIWQHQNYPQQPMAPQKAERVNQIQSKLTSIVSIV
jgi:hypothetical protein